MSTLTKQTLILIRMEMAPKTYASAFQMQIYHFVWHKCSFSHVTFWTAFWPQMHVLCELGSS